LGLGRVFSRYGLTAAEPGGVYVADERAGFAEADWNDVEEDWNVVEARGGAPPEDEPAPSFGSRNLVT